MRVTRHDGSTHIISNTVQASTMIVKGPLYLRYRSMKREDGMEKTAPAMVLKKPIWPTTASEKPRDFNSRGSHASTPLRSEKIFVLTMTWPRSTVLMMLAIVARSGVAGNLLPSRLDVQIQDA
jgi:hypothetical protein